MARFAEFPYRDRLDSLRVGALALEVVCGDAGSPIMTIEIHQPELEQRVREKILSGHFHDMDELLSKALDALEKEHPANSPKLRKNLAEFLMESPFAGAGLDLERRKQYMRPVDL